MYGAITVGHVYLQLFCTLNYFYHDLHLSMVVHVFAIAIINLFTLFQYLVIIKKKSSVKALCTVVEAFISNVCFILKIK